MTNATQEPYSIPLRRIDGTESSLQDFGGDVLLVVNVASECGLTPQYAGLERLHEEFRDRGFAVLGFPCNQFGAQEPGSNAQIAQFCSTRFNVTFPMFEKLDVNGETRHPLYRWLVGESGGGDVTWNFEKFLIARDGTLLERFAPDVVPEDGTLRTRIANALGT